jgi:hypothetical protein
MEIDELPLESHVTSLLNYLRKDSKKITTCGRKDFLNAGHEDKLENDGESGNLEKLFGKLVIVGDLGQLEQLEENERKIRQLWQKIANWNNNKK